MEAYVTLDEAVKFIGKTQDAVQYYVSSAAEMIAQYCDVHSLQINDPPQEIVKLVNLELAQEMMTAQSGVKSERIGEESYTYGDSRIDEILRKLNFLPDKAETGTGIQTVNVKVI